MKLALKYIKKDFLILISTGIFAFSSLIYELVFSTLFSFLFGSTIEMYSLVIGFYLFALGLGSYFFYFVQKKGRNLINYLFLVEVGLVFVSIFGFLTVILVYGKFNDFIVKLIGFLFVIFIGILSGIELPLLNEIYEKIKKERSFSKILSIDYFGSLIAGVSFPLLLYPNLGIFGTLLFTLTLNILTTLGVVLLFQKKNIIKKTFLFILLVILSISLLFFKQLQLIVIKHLIKKMAELNWDIDKLSKLFSNVHVEVEKLEFSKYQAIYKYYLNFDNERVACLGLNGVTQVCQHNYLPHHYPYIMVEKLFNISLKDKEILILGGGDGITARFLLDKGANKITQLELDKKVVEFTRNDKDFLLMNKNSFKDINIIYGDAFLELRKLNKKFDLILDDIDISTWENSIKFTSLEFYSLLNSKLKDNGILILTTLDIRDRFPIDKKTYLLLSNLYLAGFKYVLPVKVFSTAYTNGKNEMEAYENALIVTKKYFKINKLYFDIVYGKVVSIQIKDDKMVEIKKVLDFYNKFYGEISPDFLKRNYSSILYPEYSLLKI